MTKIRIEEAVRLMISKELEKYGVDCNYVMEHQQIEDIPWYSYYKFDSKEEYAAWRDYCIDLLRNGVKPRHPKQLVERTFAWIDLAYGLKQDYLKEPSGEAY